MGVTRHRRQWQNHRELHGWHHTHIEVTTSAGKTKTIYTDTLMTRQGTGEVKGSVVLVVNVSFERMNLLSEQTLIHVHADSATAQTWFTSSTGRSRTRDARTWITFTLSLTHDSHRWGRDSHSRTVLKVALCHSLRAEELIHVQPLC